MGTPPKGPGGSPPRPSSEPSAAGRGGPPRCSPLLRERKGPTVSSGLTKPPPGPSFENELDKVEQAYKVEQQAWSQKGLYREPSKNSSGWGFLFEHSPRHHTAPRAPSLWVSFMRRAERGGPEGPRYKKTPLQLKNKLPLGFLKTRSNTRACGGCFAPSGAPWGPRGRPKGVGAFAPETPRAANPGPRGGRGRCHWRTAGPQGIYRQWGALAPHLTLRCGFFQRARARWLFLPTR
jgi:hypothetical protein